MITCEGPVEIGPTNMGDVYRTRAIKYPWAADTYLAFVWRFNSNQERQTDLVVSRDGVTWTAYAGSLGYYIPGYFNYDGYQMVEAIAQDGLIRRGDQIWQYAEFHSGPHGGGVGRTVRMKQRLDGFVSLDAGAQTGSIVTKPLIYTGSQLTLNVQAVGQVRVALLDENGQALAGFDLNDCDPIQTDSTEVIATWNGQQDISTHAGQTVRIKFELQNAKLFAFEIKDIPQNIVHSEVWTSFF